MSMSIEQQNEDIVTTMTGPVTDQAALRGILEKIWDLNLTLLSVTRPVPSGYFFLYLTMKVEGNTQ